jgi:uncharacterized protein YjiS (DUF1127 family)
MAASPGGGVMQWRHVRHADCMVRCSIFLLNWYTTDLIYISLTSHDVHQRSTAKGIPMFAPATQASGFHFLDSLGRFFANLAAAFRGAQEAERVYRDLSSLSDAQLAERGLTRDDIARATLQALNAADRA